MSLALSDLITEEERDEVVASLLAIAALLDQPTTAWQEGNPILTLLMTASQKLADLTTLVTEITKGGFGELLPSDAWADRWALSRFNVTRVPATQATGKVNASNSSLTNYGPLQPGGLIVAHDVTGKLYRNTAVITILATTGLDDIDLAADEPGTDSNAAPGAIETVVSGQVGVGCTNPLSVLGTDQELTPALVTRARAKLGALSPNGAKDAYNYIATTPEFSATSTPITRTRTVLNPTTGALSVYLATAAGAASGPDVAIVQAAIDDNVEPWGATVTAYAATPSVVDITYEAWILNSQLTTAAIEEAIETALAEFFSTLDLGGYVVPPDTGDLYVETLQLVIGTATPGIRRVVISLPAAAVALLANEVATLGTITPTITLL